MSAPPHRFAPLLDLKQTDAHKWSRVPAGCHADARRNRQSFPISRSCLPGDDGGAWVRVGYERARRYRRLDGRTGAMNVTCRESLPRRSISPNEHQRTDAVERAAAQRRHFGRLSAMLRAANDSPATATRRDFAVHALRMNAGGGKRPKTPAAAGTEARPQSPPPSQPPQPPSHPPSHPPQPPSLPPQPPSRTSKADKKGNKQAGKGDDHPATIDHCGPTIVDNRQRFTKIFTPFDEPTLAYGFKYRTVTFSSQFRRVPENVFTLIILKHDHLVMGVHCSQIFHVETPESICRRFLLFEFFPSVVTQPTEPMPSTGIIIITITDNNVFH